MTAAVGHPTLRLLRVAIGDLPLANLAAGRWRELTPAERAAVFGTHGRHSIPFPALALNSGCFDSCAGATNSVFVRHARHPTQPVRSARDPWDRVRRSTAGVEGDSSRTDGGGARGGVHPSRGGDVHARSRRVSRRRRPAAPACARTLRRRWSICGPNRGPTDSFVPRPPWRPASRGLCCAARPLHRSGGFCSERGATPHSLVLRGAGGGTPLAGGRTARAGLGCGRRLSPRRFRRRAST
jgi:hypothetical protein